MSKQDLLLIYDQECPVCHRYCQLLRIRKTVGNLKIVNARENSDIMDEITEQGLDIDQGLVLKIGERLVYGAAAMHVLALMSSRVGAFNQLNYYLFKSKALSVLLYPLLRFFRNILLKILGKSKINNLGIIGNDKF